MRRQSPWMWRNNSKSTALATDFYPVHFPFFLRETFVYLHCFAFFHPSVISLQHITRFHFCLCKT
jgi:hypothetical protein